jgi:hypothetical protein
MMTVTFVAALPDAFWVGALVLIFALGLVQCWRFITGWGSRDDSFYGPKRLPWEGPCRECGGSGVLGDGRACSNCAGTGREPFKR